MIDDTLNPGLDLGYLVPHDRQALKHPIITEVLRQLLLQ